MPCPGRCDSAVIFHRSTTFTAWIPSSAALVRRGRLIAVFRSSTSQSSTCCLRPAVWSLRSKPFRIRARRPADHCSPSGVGMISSPLGQTPIPALMIRLASICKGSSLASRTQLVGHRRPALGSSEHSRMILPFGAGQHTSICRVQLPIACSVDCGPAPVSPGS